MAGTRKAPAKAPAKPVEEILEDVPEFDDGSDDPTGERPVEDMPEKWQSLYKRAVKRGCTEKAARLYADAHERDGEEED